MQTMLLDQVLWDIVLDASGNMAVASNPYSMAQDAASAIKTFRGECYWNDVIGLPYLTQILGKSPSPSLIKSLIVAEARTVPEVVAVQCFLTAIDERRLSGQIQVLSEQLGAPPAAIDFAVVNPQGA